MHSALGSIEGFLCTLILYQSGKHCLAKRVNTLESVGRVWNAIEDISYKNRELRQPSTHRLFSFYYNNNVPHQSCWYRSWHNLLVSLSPAFTLCPSSYSHLPFSCVGVWQNDRVEIIANDQGNRTTPSYVSFSENERLIGDAAKNQVAMNPHNTYVPNRLILSQLRLTSSAYVSVFDAKRMIGRKYDDQEVQADLKHFPFKVFNKTGKPYIRVQYRGEEKEFVSG